MFFQNYNNVKLFLIKKALLNRLAKLSSKYKMSVIYTIKLNQLEIYSMTLFSFLKNWTSTFTIFFLKSVNMDLIDSLWLIFFFQTIKHFYYFSSKCVIIQKMCYSKTFKAVFFSSCQLFLSLSNTVESSLRLINIEHNIMNNTGVWWCKYYSIESLFLLHRVHNRRQVSRKIK